MSAKGLSIFMLFSTGEGTTNDVDVAGESAIATVAFLAFTVAVVPPRSSPIGNAGYSNQSSKSISPSGSIVVQVAPGGGIGLLSISATANFNLRTFSSSLIESPANLDMVMVRVPQPGSDTNCENPASRVSRD
ncbi:unnamed protein product [Linum trigynum]|uniref:Secreted protein n=1 Tax=Linum trigynum TaxID=586398 RepID=A0AAV2F7T3_9ROSI